MSKVSQKRLDWTGACAIRLFGFGPIGELSQGAGQVEPNVFVDRAHIGQESHSGGSTNSKLDNC